MNQLATHPVVEALPYAVVVMDESGTLLLANLAAEEVFNLGRRKIIGASWQALVDDAKLWLLIRTTATNHTPATLSDHRLNFKHQPPMQVRIRLSPLLDEAYPDAVVVTLERAERSHDWAEDDIKQEINRSAGVMAAMLAHEVNNPLSGIRGAAQLLGDEVQGENKKLSELICNEVDRIRSVLDRVELFADASEVPKQQFNIHEAIRHAKSVAEHGFARGIHFTEQYDPSLPDILAGRDGVVHILLNLIKNASEALGTIDAPNITIKTQLLHGVHIRPKQGGSGRACVAVDVKDNGPGIAADIAEDIFKPYISTSDTEGRGLGLAICHKLANDMGGRLEVVESNQGACFRLMLELAP